MKNKSVSENDGDYGKGVLGVNTRFGPSLRLNCCGVNLIQVALA